MIDNPFGKIIAATLGGFFIGIIMLVIGMNTESIPILRTTMDFIHIPAGWAARLWTYKLHLPPYHEAGFTIVPMVATVLQWAFLGFLFGLWKSIK